MRRAMAISAGGAISAAALIWASSFIADVFDHQPALGDPVIAIGGVRLYAPWQIFLWQARWGEAYPRPFAIGELIVLASFITACMAMALIMRRGHEMKPFAPGAWGDFEDAKACGLFAPLGAVLGKLDGEILCFDGPEHQLLIGASRSGKGRGQVVPTLLAWPHSALVLDIKGELADGDDRHDFPGTAGFRETLGPVLRFAPTQAESHAFNPLLEVRRGANEVRDVQNIVEILVDPAGDARHHDYIEAAIATEAQAQRLASAVALRRNIVVSGGTGSGKTTLLNALLAEPSFDGCRVVILEDTAELQCSSPNTVQLLTKRTAPEIGLRDLVQMTLRLRPDRIVVGEVRDGAALEVLKAWNTGHPGGLLSLHANSAEDALSRLEDLCMEARSTPPTRLINSAIDMVVFIARREGGRAITEIIDLWDTKGGTR